MTINDLKSRVGDLRRQLADAEQRLRLARIEATGLKIGQIVISGGQEYAIAEIDARGDGKPWVVGTPRKKDGTFGTARRNLFGNWSLPTAAGE